MEEKFKDKFNNIINLTDIRWSHIIKEHPEIEPYKNKLPDVLRKPDLVKSSRRGQRYIFILPLLWRHI